MPFRDIVGHRRVTELLARSIRHGSLPQSLLFTGWDRPGKRLTAIGVAQTLNCLEPRTPDPEPRTSIRNPEPGAPNPELAFDACGVCSACLRIARGVHPDVLLVGPGDSGSIKIEQVREVIERVAYRPFEGRRRVVIVDDAEALVPQAQNALLKTLEEPPASSVFILLAQLPDLLLPTVRSRLIRLAFTESGQGEVDVDAREVAERVLSKVAGQGDPSRRIETARDLLANTGMGGAADRERLGSHLLAMAALLRDIEVLATGADARVLAHPEIRPTLDRLAPAFRGERGLRAFGTVDRALNALGGNAGIKVVADWVVLQL